MIPNENRGLNVIDQDSKQLESTLRNLRKVNWLAGRELAKVRRLNFNSAEYRTSGLRLTSIAKRMITIIKLREEIFQTLRIVHTIVVAFELACQDCLPARRRRECEAIRAENLDPDPDH